MSSSYNSRTSRSSLRDRNGIEVRYSDCWKVSCFIATLNHLIGLFRAMEVEAIGDPAGGLAMVVLTMLDSVRLIEERGIGLRFDVRVRQQQRILVGQA